MKTITKNTITHELLENFLGANFPTLPIVTKQSFIAIAAEQGLNPYNREIYITSYVGRDGVKNYSIITGYEVYIKRALATTLLDGWEVKSELKETVILKNNKFEKITELVAECIIYRKDFKQPFKKSVNFSEYAQKDKYGNIKSIWASKPNTMLEKVAISQAFRLCFASELGGLPYQAEELGTDGEIKNVSPSVSRVEKTIMQWGTDNEKNATSQQLVTCSSARNLEECNYLLSENLSNEEKRQLWEQAKSLGLAYNKEAKCFIEKNSPLSEPENQRPEIIENQADWQPKHSNLYYRCQSAKNLEECNDLWPLVYEDEKAKKQLWEQAKSLGFVFDDQVNCFIQKNTEGAEAKNFSQAANAISESLGRAYENNKFVEKITKHIESFNNKQDLEFWWLEDSSPFINSLPKDQKEIVQQVYDNKILKLL